jgi:hypothetical protein
LSAKVKLADGTEITIDELQKGYMRQSDYTKKTQELAQKRKETTQSDNSDNNELTDEAKSAMELLKKS